MKTVPVKVTYLQMLRRPEHGAGPPDPAVEITRAEKPAVAFYRFLYDSVGRAWNWVDRQLISDEQLSEIIHDDRVEIYVLHVDGKPAGYAELDRRIDGQIELAYFGIMPGFIGRGWGRRFLRWTLDKAWSYAPGRVWVHTCELDHQAALPLYRRAGFEVYDQQVIDQAVWEDGT